MVTGPVEGRRLTADGEREIWHATDEFRASGVPVSVVVVGGGLSGLACARELNRRGVEVTVFEANEFVGGRVSTEVTPDGFQLDRGFQVLSTAYPEARITFNQTALELGRFLPGAMVRIGGRFHTVADPFRVPRLIPATLRAPVGSWGDKLRLALLALDARRGEFGDFKGAELTTRAALAARGFGPEIIRRFFEPFFGGVFLESGLTTSNQMFEFVFKMFALGSAALPANGMGALAQSLVAGLPPGTVVTNAPVRRVTATSVERATGEVLPAEAVVVATDCVTVRELVPRSPERAMRGVYNLYFSAPRSPLGEPLLVLNGEGQGMINNLAVVSDVAPRYAPSGAALVSVTVLEARAEGRSIEAIGEAVRAHAREWFGADVDRWRPLRAFHVVRALPVQDPPYFSRDLRGSDLIDGVYRCGDYTTDGSINGALLSGRMVAERIVRTLGRSGV